MQNYLVIMPYLESSLALQDLLQRYIYLVLMNYYLEFVDSEGLGQQFEDIVDLFDQYHYDDDGIVHVEELKKNLGNLEFLIDEKGREEVLREINSIQTPTISYLEFYSKHLQKKKILSESNMRNFFQANQDHGKLDLCEALVPFKDPEARELSVSLRSQNHHLVDFQSFKRLFLNPVVTN